MSLTTLIEPEGAARLIDAGSALVFDCSFDLADPAAGRAIYETGHIPGAHYLDLDRDLSGAPDGSNGRHPLPDRTALAATLAGLGLSRGLQVIAYDRSGGIYAARLWWLLRWLGHKAVAVLDGGFANWDASGLPIEQGSSLSPTGGDFAASPEPASPTVTAEQIEANLAGGALRVIDVRSPDRFRGEPHPLDSASGHIPGARNLFYRDSLGPGERFRTPADLRTLFASAIGDAPLDQVVLQCGSGVTAAHALLAVEHASLTGAALYPGSWSEWTADPERLIERGQGGDEALEPRL